MQASKSANVLQLIAGLSCLVLTGSLTGCATEPSEPNLRTLTSATLLGDVSITQWGNNWQIESLAQKEGQRFRVKTYASDCTDKSGKLFVDASARIQYMRDVYSAGTSPEDKIFASLCAQGLTKVPRWQANNAPAKNSMSPQERAVIYQHLLNNVMPAPSQASETRCERVPNSRTGEIVCTTR